MNFQALLHMDKALKEADKFDETSIGMKIAPKINAIGRMIDSDEINKIVEFFVIEDTGKTLTYLKWKTKKHL